MASHFLTPKIRRNFCAFMVLLLLACVALVGIRAATTMAAWQDRTLASARFSAATLDRVQNFQCYDSESLLGTGLLANQVRFEWEAPAGFEGKALTYEIYRGQTLQTTTKNTQYVYSTTLSLNLGYTFTIRPKLDSTSWVGPSVSQRVNSIGLIVPLYMACGTG
ncbi:hypothetical protein [Glutamicibacter sp.]|uniref:hypothetical protein n=1 Tax=Glutamicibacter sp. TaxID=1931995 RepID=UPI003D6B5018